jgi:hypothetical protein
METSSQKPSFGQGLELAMLIEKAIANAVKTTNADSDKVQGVIGKPGIIFKFFEDLLADKVEPKSSMLKLISAGEKIMIEALDGKATIAEAKKIFKSYLDSDFKNWGLNKSGSATAETLVDINEIVEDGNFVQIFTALNSDLNKIVMTQAQIIRFCEKHPTLLRQDGNATFFLIKENDEYFVVSVVVFSDGLDVRVRRLESDRVWHGEYRRRVVSPQLISLAV